MKLSLATAAALCVLGASARASDAYFTMKGLNWGQTTPAQARSVFQQMGIPLLCFPLVNKGVESCGRSDALALQFTIANQRISEIELQFCGGRLFSGEFRPEGEDDAVNQIASALSAKYGKPEETGSEPKQNRFGARFERKHWAWALGAAPVAGGTTYDALMILENMSDERLGPRLTVISPKTMSDCQAKGIRWNTEESAKDDL